MKPRNSQKYGKALIELKDITSICSTLLSLKSKVFTRTSKEMIGKYIQNFRLKEVSQFYNKSIKLHLHEHDVHEAEQGSKHFLH